MFNARRVSTRLQMNEVLYVEHGYKFGSRRG
jgi:hypothetical protein